MVGFDDGISPDDLGDDSKPKQADDAAKEATPGTVPEVELLKMLKTEKKPSPAEIESLIRASGIGEFIFNRMKRYYTGLDIGLVEGAKFNLDFGIDECTFTIFFLNKAYVTIRFPHPRRPRESGLHSTFDYQAYSRSFEPNNELTPEQDLSLRSILVRLYPELAERIIEAYIRSQEKTDGTQTSGTDNTESGPTDLEI
jgi:hypothetical protein